MIGLFLQGTFPDGDDMPTEVAQGIFVSEIPGLIAFDLRFPEGAAGFRQAEVGTVFMAVPEATVDENDGAIFRQNEVGSAWEGSVFRAVDGEAVAEPVEH